MIPISSLCLTLKLKLIFSSSLQRWCFGNFTVFIHAWQFAVSTFNWGSFDLHFRYNCRRGKLSAKNIEKSSWCCSADWTERLSELWHKVKLWMIDTVTRNGILLFTGHPITGKVWLSNFLKHFMPFNISPLLLDWTTLA